ncbi:hypothetical protein Zmor_006617 [Zophobas morio]|uniref:Uncharacterized protein n=1 Tax=Zophobas morio TaxID=2755281 RepID=A0AA38IXJ3_9CUCU|nr:hypothetical protein Zmor_006617 [Zophobas morio]
MVPHLNKLRGPSRRSASRLVLEHPSRHPLPGFTAADVTDNGSSSPYILEPIGVVPGRCMCLFCNNVLYTYMTTSSGLVLAHYNVLNHSILFSK